MKTFTVKINQHHWQGGARGIASAIRKAATACGVGMDFKGARVLVIKWGV